MYDQAASVIAGVKDTRYGLDIDPRYAGMVRGLEVPVGTWYIQQQDEKSNEQSPYTEDLEKSLTQFSRVGQALDTLDTQWGQPIGTNRAIMAQNILNGALDNADDNNYALPIETHNALKKMKVSDYFESSTALKNYAAWQLAQPAGADTSVEKYNQAYWSEQNKAAIPEIYERIASGQVPATRDDGSVAPYDVFNNLTLSNGVVAMGPRQGMSTIGQPTGLSPQPGQPPTVEVPVGLPVQTGQKMHGSDGSVWVFVSSGPLSGWVEMAALQPAA
jgi:hypothetical protein